MVNILIAEDDVDFLVTLSATLRRVNYNVWAAETSEQALNLLDEQKFDFMLIDLRLGPLCGVELGEWAKLRSPDLAVAFMSGYPFIELEGRISRVSPFPVLSKPFRIQALKEIVDATVNEEKAPMV